MTVRQLYKKKTFRLNEVVSPALSSFHQRWNGGTFQLFVLRIFFNTCFCFFINPTQKPINTCGIVVWGEAFFSDPVQ